MLTPKPLSDYIPAGSAIAIAFSGGGDSTALLHMLQDYDPKPRVLIVDHNLRSGARSEALAAKHFAEDLGFFVDILTWQNNHPFTGIQEKARKARYALMGQACRELGIEYLLTGHTQDDQAETLYMRYQRGTGWRGAAGIAPSVYAPLWPELAGVTVVRPLLRHTRRALRDYNREHALNWAEDPSNQDRKYARIRAREKLQSKSALQAHLLSTANELRQGLDAEQERFRDFYKRHMRCDDNGVIFARKVPPRGLLEILLRAASGTGGPVDKAALKQLKSAMLRNAFKGGTLAGAHISFRRGEFCIARDPVAAKGRGNQPALPVTSLEPGQSCIWDGRFFVTAKKAQLKVGTVLSFPGDRRGLSQGALGLTMPIIWDQADQSIALGHTLDNPDVEIRSLVAPRLHNMLGYNAFKEKAGRK